MIALAGLAGVLAALTGAAALVVQGIRARTGEAARAATRGPVLALVGGALVSFVAIELALLTHDFSLAYVVENSTRDTPFVFLLASGWAALEGSIVLWGLVLALFTYAVWRRLGSRDGLGAVALAVIGAVGVFFFGLMATVGNPFRICTEVVSGVCSSSSWIPFAPATAPLDGIGANPLLQNHILMAVHPPLLYVGYVGLTVPFAFALSALATGAGGAEWLERTHRWSVFAWVFLTAGIVLGGWWSYEVLGWGGYWAWDPVENAAFLPWLTATAFIHSAAVQRRRGMLQGWNLVLVIATFSLTILGTFLTRSGVIASVHSFTQSPIGPAILGFLVVVTVGSFALFAARAHLVASSPRLESLASREGVFLANNLLLTLFAFAVLVGTLYPLLVEAFTGDQVSVGRPFFDRVAVPLALVLLLAMGVGPVTPYRVARLEILWARIRLAALLALVAGAGAVLLGVRSVSVVIAVAAAAFVIAAIIHHFVRTVGGRPGRFWTEAPGVLRRDRSYWGGQLAHLGVALLAVGIAASGALAVRAEVTVPRNGTERFAEYCLTYDGPFVRVEPTRRVEGARIRVLDASCETVVAVMEPRIHFYPNAVQAIATPDVRTTVTHDLYLSAAGLNEAGVVLDVFRFPLVWLVWFGGLLAAAGGAWTLGSRRVRRPDPDREPARV